MPQSLYIDGKERKVSKKHKSYIDQGSSISIRTPQDEDEKERVIKQIGRVHDEVYKQKMKKLYDKSNHKD